MLDTIETQVLIVGAGPVGLTLALDLAWRGVDVAVAELRRAGEPPSVKCNQISARSMEFFRRLGIAGKLREAGLPADYPNDVVSTTTVTGIELSRVSIPCRAERHTAKRWSGYIMADARADASDQPKVLRAHFVCQCRSASAHPHSQPDSD
jgi:2-polyprenyl-6-methoxyphenol hydroxylase-like FAD-dependent oxidoreductase